MERKKMQTAMYKTEKKSHKKRILVAGLGNSLLRDGGVGVHAVRALQELDYPGVMVAEVGTAVLDALHLIEWADNILIIDAMQAGGEPGMIHSIRGYAIGKPGMHASLHQLSFMSALELIPEKGQPVITVLGVEPESIECGSELSPPVEKAIPHLVRIVGEILACWQVKW
ncbi:MAG: hydrogenase maturation protease [Alphaproteobacteria bacterium]|uniref:Hydrogenase maturation protease n=1 Tax=Candidatus Nitrobium versatile TaxID=2884831 RepID=A0A953J5B8_9BACT|nr:hydrogenase maturation protease [Candidatus Nitrobium versatile]